VAVLLLYFKSCSYICSQNLQAALNDYITDHKLVWHIYVNQLVHP
jgi:hypothetical protein